MCHYFSHLLAKKNGKKVSNCSVSGGPRLAHKRFGPELRKVVGRDPSRQAGSIQWGGLRRSLELFPDSFLYLFVHKLTHTCLAQSHFCCRSVQSSVCVCEREKGQTRSDTPFV